MIFLYTGTPGSGKSMDLARDIIRRLQSGSYVIGNVPVNVDEIKGNKGIYVYLDFHELTVDFLKDFARLHHVRGVEGQTLVIIDEAQLKFNPRDYLIKSKQVERMEWINFFTEHRHWGYNFILATQWDRLIDRQIRSLVEYEVVHRQFNRFKWFEWLPVKIFIRIEYWYGLRMKIRHEFFMFKKKYAKIYDSYTRFEKEDMTQEERQALENKIMRKYQRPKKKKLQRWGGPMGGGLTLKKIFGWKQK